MFGNTKNPPPSYVDTGGVLLLRLLEGCPLPLNDEAEAMTREKAATWLEMIGRFRLGDLAILISLIVFLASRPTVGDTEARADIKTVRQVVDQLDRSKEDKVSSNAKQEIIINRLKDIQDHLDRIDNKLDKK